jgi:glucokinase
MEKPYVIGIDIGGTTTKFGIVDARGTIISQGVIDTQTHEKFEMFIDELYAALKKLIDNAGGIEKIRGIGVGAPNANYYTGDIEAATNLRWKGTIHLRDMMSKKFGVPAAVTNDANAAAMGEMLYGAARGMKNFIMITLGTGVGSGIVIDGKVVYGHDGFAGELGHVTSVRHNGRSCGCGKVGCLETYTSATGVARTAREMLEIFPERKSILRDITCRPITSKDVYEAAIQGDEVAIEIFEFTGKMLGEAMADFVAFSRPEAIILFGGLIGAGDLLLNPIVKSMDENLISFWKGKVKVLFSKLKESDVAILGASALAWEL